MRCISKLRGGGHRFGARNNFGNFTRKKIRSYGIDRVVRQTTNKKFDVKKQNKTSVNGMNEASFSISRNTQTYIIIIILVVWLPVANAPDVLQPCGLLYYV
jgi:hypothetical protein